MKPADLQTEWARLLVDALARSSVTELVVSPGSRSTPFLLAFLEHGGFRVHEHVDERVAGFFALGQARATGRPSVLLCTSGSAPAHYFPALVEASVSHLPMIVLSADRPVAFLACGESQTIDQVKLFGDHVRHFVDLGTPVASAGGMHALRRHVAQTVARSLSPVPGPVHLDARATRPLEPVLAETEEALAVARRAADVRAAPLTRVVASARTLPDEVITEVAELLGASERLLVVAGPAHVSAAGTRDAVSALARALHAPVLAEATSQLRFGVEEAHVVGAFDAVFRAAPARSALAPTLVLQLEGAPIAKGLSLLDEQLGADRVVLASHGHPDPTSRARLVLTGDVRDALTRITAKIAESPARAAYAARVFAAERAARAVVERSLEALGDTLSEGAVAFEVSRVAERLFVGNSLPVRELDTWCVPSRTGPAILSQRGASGIDGNLAGAAGSALSMGHTFALVGDVTFLHDLGGLAAAAHAPLCIVVINNGGGRIFEQLPIASLPDAMPYFTTPHHADLEAASRVFGIEHVRVQTRTSLRAALVTARSHGRATVIEAAVPPSAALAQHRALWAATDAAIAGVLA